MIDNALEIPADSEKLDKNKNPLGYHSTDIDTLKTSQEQDPETKEVIDDIESDKHSEFLIEDGLLYHSDKGTKT